MVLIEEIIETPYEKVLRLKGEGNDAFRRHDNGKAKSLYTQALTTLAAECKADDALSSPPLKATLLSNRCQVFLALGVLDSALDDATDTVAIAPSWPKAHHRLGSVLMRTGEYTLAFESYQRAAQLDSGDIELGRACEKAREAMAALPEDARPTGAPAEQDDIDQEDIEPSEEPAAVVKLAESVPKVEKMAAAQSVAVLSESAEPQTQRDSATADEPRGLETPHFEVVLTEASSNGERVAECVVTVWLPLVESMKQLDVEISSRRLVLKAAGLYELHADLPRAVCDTQAKARFAGKGARKGTLTIRVPLSAHD